MGEKYNTKIHKIYPLKILQKRNEKIYGLFRNELMLSKMFKF